eukprot:6787835-Pyramimonas_sp.AAC.1
MNDEAYEKAWKDKGDKEGYMPGALVEAAGTPSKEAPKPAHTTMPLIMVRLSGSVYYNVRACIDASRAKGERSGRKWGTGQG